MASPRAILFSLYVLLCLGALTWPGYAWLGNRIEPFVLGLPFSLAWILGWVLISFLALLAFHASRPDRAQPEPTRSPDSPSGPPARGEP